MYMILLKLQIFNTHFEILNKTQVETYTIQLLKIKAPTILCVTNMVGA